jgi:hypothetical protein
MKTESSNRESQRVTELASEYRNKGFEVITPHSTNESPDFLRNSGYFPDIIARSPEENLIIEVKSQQSSGDLGRLSEIAELVNSQPSWQFVLVLTNPREAPSSISQPSTEKAGLLLAKSRAIGTQDQTHVEAAFLFAWAALEASLRLLPEERRATKTPSTPWTLIRNAAMEGHIGRDDAKTLDRLFKLRNSLLHAGGEASPSINEVESLRRITEEIIHTNTSNEA